MPDHSTPNLPSTDLKATSDFYAKLGFSTSYIDCDWLILERGGLTLEFYPLAIDPRENSASCCFRVDDTDALFQAFSLANLPISGCSIPRLMPVTASGAGKSFDLVDADGNLIRCIENQDRGAERLASRVSIRLLGKSDEHVFNSVAEGLFDHPVKQAKAAEFLGDPRHHIAVAIAGDQLVGFASAVHYVHPDQDAQLFINEVAVDENFRRRGVGKAILRTLLGVGRRLGCSEAWVLTDRENQAAMALYASVGAGEESPEAVMFTYLYEQGGDSREKSRTPTPDVQ